MAGKLDDNAEDVTESNSPDNQFNQSNRQPWLQPRSNGASSRVPQPPGRQSGPGDGYLVTNKDQARTVILHAQDPSFSVSASLDSDSGFPSGVGAAFDSSEPRQTRPELTTVVLPGTGGGP